ncbi:Lysosomal Pro-X carboxypeptidase [Schistosoma japonicum]|nr:Lysosomal Pro-X carboxypeptidase [Schistosoma japonicum]
MFLVLSFYFLIPLSFAFLTRHFPVPLNKDSQFKYETKYFRTKIDHFSFVTDEEFEIKYLINNESFSSGGPILFYTGNEGAIETFAENSGFIWKLAEELNASVVFAEHRYYGTSLPFGNDSFKDRQHFGYLTAEQALADYVLLINQLKINYSCFASSPVISFGGSYGGMLSAWIRQKYPNQIAGAIASSAPVWLFPGLSDCNGFSLVATDSFLKYGGDNCVKNIQHSWSNIVDIGQSFDGKELLTNMFNICTPLTDVQNIIDYLSDYLGTISMVNYPYPANFLGTLPAWPVKYLCSNLTVYDPQQPVVTRISLLAKAILALTNYTGNQNCLDISGSLPGIDAKAWEIQTCMEMTTPMCASGAVNIMPPVNWDLNSFSAYCQKQYGISPRVNWPKVEFWSKSVDTITNVVFSNGEIDPWFALSITNSSYVPFATVINIADAAHHLDLRTPNPADPDSVVKARTLEKQKIIQWIKEWKRKHTLLKIFHKFLSFRFFLDYLA